MKSWNNFNAKCDDINASHEEKLIHRITFFREKNDRSLSGKFQF